MTLTRILQLDPEYRDYVWGGARLRPAVVPTAEAWVVYENNRVASGPLAGRTLAELAVEYGAALLGRQVTQRTGTRFPLLIKLLDCAQWLSLQVHPNDQQALALEGTGQFGKTEAWQILEADQHARLIGGLRPDVTSDILAKAIQDGTILDWVHYLEVRSGDTIFMPPGTIHALGPGLLIYEIQETSDITYRVWDWGRPQTGGRLLHIEKSLAVADPASQPRLMPLPEISDGQAAVLTRCPYFTLKMLRAHAARLELDTLGESFHTLTVIEGSVEIRAGGDQLRLGKYQTALVPAAAGEYALVPDEPSSILQASVEAATQG
jgi:mannose-6-phosphate isomerase